MLNTVAGQIIDGQAAIYMSAVRQYPGSQAAPALSFICKLEQKWRRWYKGRWNAISDLRASISSGFRRLVAAKVRPYGWFLLLIKRDAGISIFPGSSVQYCCLRYDQLHTFHTLLSVRMIKPKRLKLETPNLTQEMSIMISRPSIKIRSKGQRSKSQGHEVQKGDRVADVSYALCRVPASSFSGFLCQMFFGHPMPRISTYCCS